MRRGNWGFPLVKDVRELPSWVRCERVISQQGQKPLNSEAEDSVPLWDPLPGSAQ
jgi:hypothetical protein